MTQWQHNETKQWTILLLSLLFNGINNQCDIDISNFNIWGKYRKRLYGYAESFKLEENHENITEGLNGILCSFPASLFFNHFTNLPSSSMVMVSGHPKVIIFLLRD